MRVSCSTDSARSPFSWHWSVPGLPDPPVVDPVPGRMLVLSLCLILADPLDDLFPVRPVVLRLSCPDPLPVGPVVLRQVLGTRVLALAQHDLPRSLYGRMGGIEQVEHEKKPLSRREGRGRGWKLPTGAARRGTEL